MISFHATLIKFLPQINYIYMFVDFNNTSAAWFSTAT